MCVDIYCMNYPALCLVEPEKGYNVQYAPLSEKGAGLGWAGLGWAGLLTSETSSTSDTSHLSAAAPRCPGSAGVAHYKLSHNVFRVSK